MDAAATLVWQPILSWLQHQVVFQTWIGMEITPCIPKWLLLDSRVVGLLMAYNPTFVMLSFLKPLFFNSLKNALRFLDNAGA